MSEVWSDDQIDEMLRRMGEGETITSIAVDPRMPSYTTMWRMENGGDELAERITHAREMGFVARAEQAVESAKSATDAVKGRLAFDADRWFLGKMCPKRFGDKQAVEHSGPDGAPIPMRLTDADLERIAAGKS